MKNIENKPWEGICTKQCWFARKKKCTCRCGGKYHGYGVNMKLDEYNIGRKPLGEVPREVWVGMLRIASDLDLNKGGLYDARTGAINIWVVPEDKPADWNFEITRGALKYPRAFLASIYAYRKGDVYQLSLDVVNYERKHKAEELFEKGEISYKEYRQMVKTSEEGTLEEWKWAFEKAKWLIEMAKKETVFEEVIYCPFCGKEFRNLSMFNIFVSHLPEHVQIKSIIQGNGICIVTERGIFTPEDYVKTVRRARLS